MCTDNQLDRWDAERMEEYREMVYCIWYIEGQALVLSLINMLTFIYFVIEIEVLRTKRTSKIPRTEP